MGIRRYEERATFKDILNEIKQEKYSQYLCNIASHINLGPPSQFLFKSNIENQIIKNIHKLSKNHDIVLLVYHNFYQSMKKNSELFSDIHHISLYILTAALTLDENISINKYIDIIHQSGVSLNTKNNIKDITKELVEKTIINIMKNNNYALL